MGPTVIPHASHHARFECIALDQGSTHHGVAGVPWPSGCRELGLPPIDHEHHKTPSKVNVPEIVRKIAIFVLVCTKICQNSRNCDFWLQWRKSQISNRKCHEGPASNEIILPSVSRRRPELGFPRPRPSQAWVQAKVEVYSTTEGRG